jgi:hypothetical protein
MEPDYARLAIWKLNGTYRGRRNSPVQGKGNKCYYELIKNSRGNTSFTQNTDRIFISTYKSYWNGKEWCAQGYWNWYRTYRTYWRSCVIIWALYRLCWIVWLVYVVRRYVAVIIGCDSEMYSCLHVDLSIHILFYVKYISVRILLMSAIFYCS